MRTAILGVAALVLAALPAHAQYELITGIYARSPEQCEAARKDTAGFLETGETLLTPRGIVGVEYHCEFVDWKLGAKGDVGLVTMICEETEKAYPEMYAVSPRGKGLLQFGEPLWVPQDDLPSNAGLYYLCEGVSLPVP